MTVFEQVKVRVKMLLYEGSSCLGMVPVMVTGVVADVSHNILSTGHMVAAGWEVKLSKDEISLRRLKGVWLVIVRGPDVHGFVSKDTTNQRKR